MEENQSLTSEESLELILNMITQTKENLKENGFLFLLWGWLLSVASLCMFLLENYTNSKYFYAPFPILAAAGIITTVAYYNKKARMAETYLDHFLRKLWMILIMGFVSTVLVSAYQGTDSTAYILIMEGIGTMVSGTVMKFKPLKLGGVVFFTAAFCTLFVPAEYKNLIHGLAIIAGYIIPGYKLKNYNE